MIRPPYCRKSAVGATTLIELLTSMAILAVLLTVLAATLQASLGQFRSSVDQSKTFRGSQFAMEWLRRDLNSAANAFPSNLPPLPASLTDQQLRFFSGKAFFPFEINRSQGRSAPQASGFPSSNQNFATLAFPKFDSTDVPAQNSQTNNPAFPAIGLVGYYVAYTRDSDLTQNPRYSMKLFRHFRPPGSFGDGYSDGFLRFTHREINDSFADRLNRSELPLAEPNTAAIRRLQFENRDLPFLFSSRLKPNDEGEEVPTAGSPPTPEFSDGAQSLASISNSEMEWLDAKSVVYDFVFPDEAVAKNVTRFELTPFRVLEDATGNEVTFDTVETCQELSIPDTSEWPSLVLPTYIEVTLGVIDDEIASRLTREDDWIVDWSNGASPRSETENMVKENTELQRFRISIGTGK